tara:strand:- start:756 stop:935 length:180 start_codon:yes stop_codon:yes gene_type:complete
MSILKLNIVSSIKERKSLDKPRKGRRTMGNLKKRNYLRKILKIKSRFLNKGTSGVAGVR